MYRITYIHKDSTTEHPLYTAGDQEYCLTDCTLTMEMGKAGELDIYVPIDNPAREEIECLTDEIIFYRDDVEIWRGRPVTMQIDFNRTGRLTCEGILAYLYDTYFEPFEFQGPPAELFEDIINNHNGHVEERKQFKIGRITVEDNNDYINRSSIYYNRSLEVLTDKLINDSLGGYFRVRVESDGRYIDYLTSYDTEASQAVEYGSNILDIAEEVEFSSLATVILPLGARLEDEDGNQTDEYTTIASVNGGSIYYQDDNAVDTYGWICVCAEWEDITEPSNLLTKAIAYLEQVTGAVSSFEINAVDLSLVSSDYEPISLGDYVRIRSDAHGINQFVELTKMTIHPLAPENDVLQFGADSASITGTQRNSERAVQSALGSLTMRVTNLTADVINAVYANIETIIAGTVDADYIKARIADIGYATIDYLEANYLTAATIEADYIKATSEWVYNLDAWVANINTLLAGSAGVGELQTIHLTADNVVIDDAVIMDLIAQDAIIGTLLAGYINTDVITIQSDSGGYITSGATTQYFDSDGNIRIQIGQDASGNFTFVLYDSDGEGILIDTDGIHASAVPDGLIVNDMVSDNANISGYKVDIQSMTQYLNEYGGLTMEAAQITIDGERLDYRLTTITDMIGSNSEVINTIQTELSAVQGDITAKIWMTDIETALDDYDWETPRNYCLLSGGYKSTDDPSQIFYSMAGSAGATAYDGYLRITGTSSTSRVYWGLSPDLESGVSYRVSIKWRGSSSFSVTLYAYYASGTSSSLSSSRTVPSDWGVTEFSWTPGTSSGNPPVALGFAVTSSSRYVDVEYIMIELSDTAHDWTRAPEDYALVSDVTTLTDQWSQLELTVNSITAEVGSLQTTSTSLSEQITSIQATVNGLSSTVSDVQTSLDGVEKNLSSQIEQLAGSIKLSVTNGSLGNTAQITLSADTSTSSINLDLTKVRQAFANDTTAITISAGTITLASGILLISSGQLILDSSGNATFSGNLSAPTGTIGGWTISTSSLYNGCSSSTSTTNGIYLGNSYIRNYYNGAYVDINSAAIKNGNADGDIAELYSGTLRFTRSSTNMGYYGTAYNTVETSKYGLVINVEYAADFIAFGRKTSSSASVYTWDYLINYGLSTSNVGYAQKHVFYGTSRFTGNMYLSNYLYANAAYFYNSSETAYGYVGTGTSSSQYGIVIHQEYASNFFAIGRKTSSSASSYTWDYVINYNLSSSSYSQKHILYGTVRITDNLYLTSIYFRNSGSDTYYFTPISSSSSPVGIGTNGRLRATGEMVCGGSTCYTNYMLTVNGSGYATGTFYSASDLSLKTDVRYIETEGDTILDALTPITYRYKTDDKRMHFGVTYQNVCEALEAAGLDPADSAIVSRTQADDEDKGLGEETGAVAYTELIGLLIYEVKKLKTQMEEMRA